MFKSRMMDGWACSTYEEITNAYKILVRSSEDKCSLQRPICRLVVKEILKCIKKNTGG
jgi:hypothetical protein